MLVPIHSTQQAAPTELLKTKRCACTTMTNCESSQCTCRKHGLECSTACKECSGVSCSNVAITTYETPDDDDDDDDATDAGDEAT